MPENSDPQEMWYKFSTDMQKINPSGAFKLDNSVPCSASCQNSISFWILSNLNRAVIESNQEGQNSCHQKKVGVKFDISSYFILFAANNHIHSSSSQRFKVQNGSVVTSHLINFAPLYTRSFKEPRKYMRTNLCSILGRRSRSSWIKICNDSSTDSPCRMSPESITERANGPSFCT